MIPVSWVWTIQANEYIPEIDFVHGFVIDI